MALIKFNGIGISALAAAVPSNVINNLQYTEYFSEEEARAIVEKTGIKERRFVKEGVCASDLCYAAAMFLISLWIVG